MKSQSNAGNGDICITVFMLKEELARLREGRIPGIELRGDLKAQLPEVPNSPSSLTFMFSYIPNSINL